ncbi:MAG: hypothetical protein P8L85_05500 [Rubripirellula sp.]|nr:hypothetical protein [Rubripirellula sp.]
MTQARKKRTALALGHDAFLDIVANLVGILIILVVVLGAQSTAAIEEIKEQTVEESESELENQYASNDQLARLAQDAMRAAAAQADSNRFEQRIKEYDQRVEIRKRQRGAMLDLLTQAKLAWQEEKQKIDQEKLVAAERQTEFDKTKSELESLKGQRERLENEPEEVVAIQHLPTPMAKTVFGEELHFRLKGNRLSIVPVEKLLDEIRRDFKRIAPRSRDGLMDAAVGPIQGYVARYQMAKNRQMVSQGGQVQMATRIQLVGMTVEPLDEPHGQPIQQVLANRRQLDVELAGRQPDKTTITVWVYPDSFAAFRQLKEHLYSRGYATAARPLPMDHAISGGPQGTRSNAQ